MAYDCDREDGEGEVGEDADARRDIHAGFYRFGGPALDIGGMRVPLSGQGTAHKELGAVYADDDDNLETDHAIQEDLPPCCAFEA